MSSSTSTSKLTGLIFLAAGIGLAIWGYQESGGLVSQVSSAVTGSATDNVMIKYIGGAIGIVIGAFFIIKK